MLTNLDWLAPGKPFPPPAEKDRLDRYKANEQLFLSNHADVWREDFEAIARRLRKKERDVETVLNYQQLLSKKTADFVCGEPPDLETDGDTDALSRLLERLRWNTRLYEAVIDISRYGNAVLKLVGKGVTAVSPLCWFPVVVPADLKTVSCHVIAYPVSPDENGVMTELYAELHSPGFVEQRFYAFDGQDKVIGGLKCEAVRTATGLPDYAVQVLTNVTHSGSLFGVDDYTVVNSLAQKVMWRLHCADTILDKHSEPSMSGPASALERDERTGLYFVNLGNYFKRGTSNDPDVQYITWDGNLDANFKEIDLLINQLYTLSEMGQAFMEGGGGGAADSGTALKLRMVSPRIKAARIVGMNEATVKQLLVMLAQVNGIRLNYDSLTLHWHDGLPDDEVEQVQTLTTATGGKAIMSQYAAMKRLGLSDEQVEEELEQMAEERASSAPVQLGMIDPNDEPPGGEGGGDG